MRLSWGLAMMFWVACAAPHPRPKGASPSTEGGFPQPWLQLTPPDSALQYTFSWAKVESLQVRIAYQPVARAEVLVWGYLPDGCTELHEVRQVRQGARIEVELLTRRPVGVLCTQAIRPFRYYVFLPDALSPGRYELVVNGYIARFEVR